MLTLCYGVWVGANASQFSTEFALIVAACFLAIYLITPGKVLGLVKYLNEQRKVDRARLSPSQRSAPPRH